MLEVAKITHRISNDVSPRKMSSGRLVRFSIVMNLYLFDQKGQHSKQKNKNKPSCLEGGCIYV